MSDDNVCWWCGRKVEDEMICSRCKNRWQSEERKRMEDERRQLAQEKKKKDTTSSY